MHFYPTICLKNQYLEKKKKKTGDIIMLHMCTVNDNHKIYGSWDLGHNRYNFCHFGLFFALLAPNDPENQTFFKNEKMPGHIILHMYTINGNHIMYGSWDMHSATDRTFCHFGPFFTNLLPPPISPNNPQNKNFDKIKKLLEILSFYTYVPKIMITWCMVPEIWCAMDGQTDERMESDI